MSTPALSEMTTADMAVFLHRMLELMSQPIYLEPASSRVRVTMEAGTLPVVTTVSSVTALGGYDAKLTLLASTDNNTWVSQVRSRIS